MAVLVLVDFADEEEARAFIEHCDGVSSIIHQGEVVAVYKRPTMYHEPFDTHGAKKTDAGFTKGQKWGWWVCNVCKRPSRLFWQSITQKECSFGKNILSMFVGEKVSEPS